MRHQPDPPAPLFGHGFNYRAMAEALDVPHPRTVKPDLTVRPVDPNVRAGDKRTFRHD